MDYKNIILRLQQLYFCVEDLSYDIFDDRGPREIISKYQKILTSLYQRHPEVFDNLLQIGVNELRDHLALLNDTASIESIRERFDDLKYYIQESIIDTRKKVKDLIR